MAKHMTIREKGNEWCRLEIDTSNGYLSICGSHGHILTPAAAKRAALEYWRSFFEDSPAEIFDMNKRQGTRFTSSTSAARYVLNHDGQYHGLDVIKEEGSGRKGKVYVLDGCGRVGEELRKWFPEIAPVLRWHLFGLPGSEHPEFRRDVEACPFTADLFPKEVK